MGLTWLAFVLCSGGIVYSGTNLSRYGDVIAEKSGFGRAWVGLVLTATVTSLPELVTGISSSAFAGTPDIALGDIMGSCVFNLAIIALMDILHGTAPIFSKAEQGHILSAAFGIILIGIASTSILVGGLLPPLGTIGLYTPALAIIYGIGVRSVYLFEKRKLAHFVDTMAETLQYEHISLREAVVKYALNSVIIIGCAGLLPFIGARLAATTGLGQSFFGSVFIALTTSLPELVVSVTALKIGATDMAIANLFGSNMFNIFILAIDDCFYRKGPILSNISPSHAVTGMLAMIMTGIAIVGLTYRSEKKNVFRLGWDAAAILLAYGVNIFFLYGQR